MDGSHLAIFVLKWDTREGGKVIVDTMIPVALWACWLCRGGRR